MILKFLEKMGASVAIRSTKRPISTEILWDKMWMLMSFI